MASALILKLLSIVAIFAVGVAGGLVALRARTSPRAETFLAFGNAFSAGVFLGAGLLHLLPDSNDALQSFFGDLDFPVGYLLAAIGFVLVLFLEQVALSELHESAGEDREPTLTPYTLAIILSAHSLLAGAALGAEDTMIGASVILFAILAHKGAAGFALVVDFQRTDMPVATVRRVLLIFAMMTPLGVLLGYGLTEIVTSRYEGLVEGIFDALAAGTFLYIAILEIIHEEFSRKTAIRTKFALLCGGLGLMAAIALVA